MNIHYKTQESPRGIAEALILGEDFLNKSCCTLILGDNLFYGDKLTERIRKNGPNFKGAKLFGHIVRDPCRYGVVEFNQKMEPLDIKEKPKETKSNIAVTGIYFYDSSAVSRAKDLVPSKRGRTRNNRLKQIILKRR